MAKRKSEYKPLLFTTTMRNPERMQGFLKILSNFNKKVLTNNLSEKIMTEIIRYGLYRPMKQHESVKNIWEDTKSGEFSNILLSKKDAEIMVQNNPQSHKEAGFEKGWPSRFATCFDLAKELGFVYFSINKKIEFSKIGLKLSDSIDLKITDDEISVSHICPELEQQAFLNALVKYQRNNPFLRVLNENAPLILLLKVIRKLNSIDKSSNKGISKLELPLLIFWKDDNVDELVKKIMQIRTKYGYSPSWEVISDICINKIMGGFKEFKIKSIMSEYPDEFVRKMRLTGLISLRGGGRFIGINKYESKKINYILKKYSSYKKYKTEKEYFDYMAKTDKNLISLKSNSLSISKNDKQLKKWTDYYSFDKIKKELSVLSKKSSSKDEILKYLPHPVRLEFLVALAIKSKFPKVKVIPNYPCDDEGIPTSTAGGGKGDINCYENENGVLVEVTMSGGRAQTMMEIWPIKRHLEDFIKEKTNSICLFIAPSIFEDSKMQIEYVKSHNALFIYPKTIEEFLKFLDVAKKLYIAS